MRWWRRTPEGLPPRAVRAGVVAAVCAGLVLSCTPASPPASGDQPPRPGQKDVIRLSYGGQTLYEADVEYVDLEEGTGLANHDPAATVVAVVVAERGGAQRRGAKADTPGVAAIRQFMADVWDPYVGGAADPGVDAVQLLVLLRDLELGLDEFMALYAAGGQPMGTLVADLQAIHQRLPSSDGADLLDVLDIVDLDYAGFQAALAKGGLDWPGFLALLASRQLDLDGFADAYARAGLPLDSYLAQLQGERPKLDAITAATIGILVTKWVWTLIRDGRPVIALDNRPETTRALAAKDPDPVNYAGARDAVYGPLTVSLLRVTGQMTLRASYAAQSPNVDGEFIPDCFVTLDGSAPDLFQRVEASVKITNVNNTARPPRIVPELEVSVTFRLRDWNTYVGRTFNFAVNGQSGIQSLN